MNGSLLFIISGPAGSGKGSVVAEVLRRDDRFMCAISATTRPCLAGEVDGVNAVAVRCADGSLAVFAVNRSLEATAEFEIRLQDGAQPASVEAQTLHDDDLFAANTLYDQNRVTPHANGSAMYDAESGVVRVSLPPVSWTALHIK